jgi:transposase
MPETAEAPPMADDYDFYIGLDWGTDQHQACVLDAAGRRIGEHTITHSGAGLAAWLAALARYGPAARLAVAIEVPRGAVVDALLAHGCHVYALNPKQLDRFRDRQTVAGAKDDRRDAGVLADALRTDRGVFRARQPDDPRLGPLRELTRLARELGTESTRLTNRLREQLVRSFPQVLTLCPAADEPWLWTLLDHAPTATQAARLRPQTLRALLAKHRVRRFTAADLSACLQAPPLPAAAGTIAAAGEHIAFLLPRLRLASQQRRQCDRRLEQLLDVLATGEPPLEHRDVTILRSLPGVGRLVAATMLAEAWPALAARDYQMLRTHSGVAPVTRQSGKTRLVTMRRSCNGHLREAVFHWASNSLRLDPRCRAHYDRLRRRHGHARALRGVADRLLSLLIALLRAGTLYDPARRQVAA